MVEGDGLENRSAQAPGVRIPPPPQHVSGLEIYRNLKEYVATSGEVAERPKAAVCYTVIRAKTCIGSSNLPLSAIPSCPPRWRLSLPAWRRPAPRRTVMADTRTPRLPTFSPTACWLGQRS